MTSIAAHLAERHVDLSRYRVAIDEQERVATFLLYNLSGGIVGYQQYRPDSDKKAKNNAREGRYFTYRTKGEIAVFGLETFRRPGPLFLAEGIFDTVRLHNLGLAAVGTLTNDPRHIIGWLRTLSRRKVAVCDPGPTGAPLAKLGDEVVTCPGDKDLGAMTDAEVFDLLAPYQKMKSPLSRSSGTTSFRMSTSLPALIQISSPRSSK